jgi:UDP-N-acetylglucosamine 4,6-dehydratase
MFYPPSLDNKTVFVTGGTGSIGSQVVRDLLTEGAKVVVYSRDQNKQFSQGMASSSKRVTYLNGDICDYPLTFRSLTGADLVVHCAASKHVAACEENPDSAIKINVEGTRNVLMACMARGVKKFLLLSSDKAVHPACVMGTTKFLAERLTLEFGRYFPCSVVRLGNVFGSSGSVVEVFRDRIKNKLPLIVKDPSASRYFVTRREAGGFIVDCLKRMEGGEIFLKQMKHCRISQIAQVIAEPGYPIAGGNGLEQGEKANEALFSNDEMPYVQSHGTYFVFSKKNSPRATPSEWERLPGECFSNDEIKDMLKGAL